MDGLSPLPGSDVLLGALRAQPPEGARAAAQEFEALFASLLVKELRRGLPQGFFGEGAGADVYSGWLDEHLGAALAEGRGLGLREALQRSLGDVGPQGGQR